MKINTSFIIIIVGKENRINSIWNMQDYGSRPIALPVSKQHNTFPSAYSRLRIVVGTLDDILNLLFRYRDQLKKYPLWSKTQSIVSSRDATHMASKNKIQKKNPAAKKEMHLRSAQRLNE